MYLTLIIFPLLASVVSGLLGRVVGSRGAQIITCSFIFLTTVIAINMFFEVGFNNTAVSLQLFRWIDSESLNVYWGFNFDSLTVSMLIPVLIISTLVHLYSIGYMAHDPHIQRFFSYLSLFTFMMVILVTANNLLLMFVGWEGVGVCSYLLVSFWYTRIAANQSSLAAFLTNRVGDCLLTIGMFIILWTMGNIDYATIFSLSPYINENIITIIGICLLIGAMAKSSQIGLHVWLPMAMEGPTPVSALIHAATMVTAGVYLLIRSSPLLEYSSTALLLCLWIGAITTVFSSLIGLFQQDIKKVIAYSTMSQLGMMVIAVGLSSYNIALFHLINHAFYKGLLFLAAGSVIHAVADNQDFRKYGGLRAFLPLTYSVMLIASLSLVAFPFMTGFYSKDFILESAYGQFYFSSNVVYYIASIGAIFTTLYSVKVLYLTFLTNPNGSLSYYRLAHEGDIFMSLPLMVLAVFSIFFGYLTKDIFIGIATGFFIDNSIFIHPNHEILIETEFAVPVLYKILPFINTVAFTVIAFISSEFYPNRLMNFKFSRLGYNIFGFFNQRFLIEMFYNKYITNMVLHLGGQTTKVLDKGSVEYLGPYGLSLILTNMSNFIGKLDSGVITNYALYILSGLVFYLFIQYTNLIEDANLMTLLYGILVLIYLTDYKFVDKFIGSVITQAMPRVHALLNSSNKSQLPIFAFSFASCDAPKSWELFFQDSASSQMEALVDLHNNIMFYLFAILFAVSWILLSICRNYTASKTQISNKYLNHGTLIELIWTIIPALILILIAFPSFRLLYLMDEVTNPNITVSVEGHQWYWSYQYADFINDDADGEFDDADGEFDDPYSILDIKDTLLTNNGWNGNPEIRNESGHMVVGERYPSTPVRMDIPAPDHLLGHLNSSIQFHYGKQWAIHERNWFTSERHVATINYLYDNYCRAWDMHNMPTKQIGDAVALKQAAEKFIVYREASIYAAYISRT